MSATLNVFVHRGVGVVNFKQTADTSSRLWQLLMSSTYSAISIIQLIQSIFTERRASQQNSECKFLSVLVRVLCMEHGEGAEGV